MLVDAARIRQRQALAIGDQEAQMGRLDRIG